MTNFSKTPLSPVEDGPPYNNAYNNTGTSSSSNDGPGLENYYVFLFISFLFICIIGLLGNGTVICLLGFCIKRSPFTTYILNLAVADFGVLLFFSLHTILYSIGEESFRVITPIAFMIMQNTSQLLLTAISIDRCVAVSFPIWHRCHRPPRLSTMVCALIWVLSWLPSGSLAILIYFDHLRANIILYLFNVASALCLPLLICSTIILFIKMFCKSKQPRRGRLLTVVLLTFLFFLIFAFPLNAILIVSYFTGFENEHLLGNGIICACLNSCVNPVIYYMVGRKKRGQQRQSLRVILQRAFKEEEEQRGEQGPTAVAMTPVQ